MPIITNPEALAISFIPEKLLHREKEREQILYNVKNSVNTFIYGSIGSGKTALIKHTITKFNGVKNRAIYIDCSLYQTTNAILREILSRMSVVIFSRSNYDLQKKLEEKTKDKKPIVCLDHFEHLKDADVVGKLVGMGLCVLIVSDGEESYVLLDSKTKSSVASIVKIADYTDEQVFDILMERAKEALADGSYTETIIKKIAEGVKGNVAEGINVLRASALKAESEKRNTIDESDLEHDCPLAELTKDQKIILEILREWKELPSGKLFSFYKERAKFAKGERTFRKYMEVLCEKGFVKADGDKRGRVYEIVEGEAVEDNSDG